MRAMCARGAVSDYPVNFADDNNRFSRGDCDDDDLIFRRRDKAL